MLMGELERRDTDFTEVGARQLTMKIDLLRDDIAAKIDKFLDMATMAYAGRIWLAMGYESWEAYASEHFAFAALSADRAAVVQQLSATGMSTRAIAPIVAISREQVRRDLAAAPDTNVSPAANEAPKPVTGIDGKAYPATPAPKRQAPRTPLVDVYDSALWELDKAIRRLEKLNADDRFDRMNPDRRANFQRRAAELEYLLFEVQEWLKPGHGDKP